MLGLYYHGLIVFEVLVVVGFCAAVIYVLAKAAKEDWEKEDKTPSLFGKILLYVLFIVIFVVALVGALSTCTQI